MWIPPGFAHGYCVVSRECRRLLQVHAVLRRRGRSRKLLWNDPAIGIEWPLGPKIRRPIVIPRDASAPHDLRTLRLTSERSPARRGRSWSPVAQDSWAQNFVRYWLDEARSRSGDGSGRAHVCGESRESRLAPFEEDERFQIKRERKYWRFRCRPLGVE